MRSKSLSVLRPRFTPAERVGLLAEYHRSQFTQREFVEQHDLSLATLTKWLRLQRQAAKAPCRKKLSFAELPLAQVLGPARCAAEVVRPDGWTVRLMHDAPAVLVEQLLGPC
jgi:transposase-like protein